MTFLQEGTTARKRVGGAGGAERRIGKFENHATGDFGGRDRSHCCDVVVCEVMVLRKRKATVVTEVSAHRERLEKQEK